MLNDGFASFGVLGHFVPTKFPSLLPPFRVDPILPYETSKNQMDPIVVPYPHPDSLTSPGQAQIIISSYTMTSLGWAMYEIDGLNMNITEADIPSWAPIDMNTDFFAVVLPDLFFFCPNCPIKFVVVSPSWPNITLSSSTGGSVTYTTNVGWYVYQHHLADWEFAFSMNVDIAGALTLWINDENMRIYGHVTAQKVLFTLDQSVIGNVNLDLMELVVNRFLFKGVGPITNGKYK